MHDQAPPRHLRVFLCSPGDVRDERGIAVAAVDRLQYDPFVRGRATFEVVAWDRPGGGVPMVASATPQESVDAGLPRPSECDVVVAIFWRRMGTPLPFPRYRKPDGSPYLSGSEWELEDALGGAARHGTPVVLVYRNSARLLLDSDDADAEERLRQSRAVDAFFAGFVDPDSGAIRRGHKTYERPDEFREELESDLRTIVHGLLAAAAPEGRRAAVQPPLWDGSPFPGLRSFTPQDAPIFFGRGRETDQLLTHLADSRFVAVVGASGSGKSSLVGAGVLARLAAGALAETPAWLLPTHDSRTRQWDGLRCTPGELGGNPFLALAIKLAPLLGEQPLAVANALRERPSGIVEMLDRVRAGRPPGTELFVFVDQFEELFTTVPEADVEPFVGLLSALSRAQSTRTMVTLRADFYHRCVELPALAQLLEQGQFPLSAPTDTLYDMIVRPAERAGLRFEEGLVGRILDDAGRGPGALPLLAYTLDELYRGRAEDGVLTSAAYERLGGVQGAIGVRAADVFDHRLDAAARATFSPVFRGLVEVDELGRATRRRVRLSDLGTDEPTSRLLEVFTEARLLVRTGGPNVAPTVSVAHEALFTSWPRLREWIQLVQDDLRLLRKVRAAAREWDEDGRREAYLWPHERLEPVYEMVERLEPVLDPVLTAFVTPEHVRLLRSFAEPATETYRRQVTADRLVAIGESAVPGLIETLGGVGATASVRTAAASALARIGTAAVPGLVAEVRHPEVEVRLAVVGALRSVGDERGLPALAAALGDDDARVRSMAAGALRAIGGPAAANAVTEALRSERADVRWQAAGVLGAFGGGAVRPLLRALRDDDIRVRREALDALRAVGSLEPTPLLDALTDEDADTRWRACDVLLAVVLDAPAPEGGGLAEADAVLHALVRALGDEHPIVRATAALAVGALAPQPGIVRTEAVAALLPALSDPDFDVAAAACSALGAFGVEGCAAAVGLLARPRPGRERALAAAVLSAAGPAAIPTLTHLLGSGDRGLRLRASQVLVGFGAQAVPALVAALESIDGAAEPVLVEALTETLRSIGEPAVPELMDVVARADTATRRAATDILATIGNRRSRAALRTLLADPDGATRRHAARGLATLGTDGLPVLFAALQSTVPETREAARAGVVEIGGQAVPGLLELGRQDDVDVAGAARAALSDIGTPAAVFGLAELGHLPDRLDLVSRGSTRRGS